MFHKLICETSSVEQISLEVMGRLGFEPRTNRLKAECSTAELATLAGCLSSAYTKQRFYLVLSAWYLVLVLPLCIP